MMIKYDEDDDDDPDVLEDGADGTPMGTACCFRSYGSKCWPLCGEGGGGKGGVRTEEGGGVLLTKRRLFARP